MPWTVYCADALFSWHDVRYVAVLEAFIADWCCLSTAVAASTRSFTDCLHYNMSTIAPNLININKLTTTDFSFWATLGGLSTLWNNNHVCYAPASERYHYIFQANDGHNVTTPTNRWHLAIVYDATRCRENVEGTYQWRSRMWVVDRKWGRHDTVSSHVARCQVPVSSTLDVPNRSCPCTRERPPHSRGSQSWSEHNGRGSCVRSAPFWRWWLDCLMGRLGSTSPLCSIPPSSSSSSPPPAQLTPGARLRMVK